jgi:hypothetical protein
VPSAPVRALVAAAWVVGAALAAVAAYRGFRRLGTSRMEAAVGAYAAALLGPTLCTLWFWLLPLGRVAAPLLGSVVAGGVSVVALRRWAWSWRDLVPSRGAALQAAPVLLTAAGLLGASLLGAVRKPVDEWDSLMYHGPTAANVLQHGSLFGWDAPMPWIFYPNLGAIQGAMTSVVFASTDLLDAIQVPFALLLLLVAWTWAGGGRVRILPGSLVVGLLAVPVVFPQLRAMSIDVVFAATGLLGLWCVALWWRLGRQPGFLVAAAAGLGAMAASKPNGVMLLAIALGVLGLWLLLRRPARWLRTAALTASSAVFAGAPFYLRNLIELGNPLYPIQVSAGPISLDGIVDMEAFRTRSAQFADTPAPLQFFQNLWLSVTEPPRGYTHDLRIGGFGRSIVVFVIAAALAALVVAIAPVRRRLVAGLAPILLPVAIFLAVQPRNWYPRYSIVPLSLLVIATALVLGRALRPLAVAVPISLVLLVAWGGVAMNNEDRMWHGSRKLADLADESPQWNTGVTGYASTYHDLYEFLDRAPCGTRVTVVARPTNDGLYAQFSLPMWGEEMCNDVRSIPLLAGRPLGSDAVTADLRRAVASSNYIVVPEAADALVRRLAGEVGRPIREVAETWRFLGKIQRAYRVG